MNNPTRQQRYVRGSAFGAAVLTLAVIALLAQSDVAQAATDAWLAAETTATLQITAPESEDQAEQGGPVGLGGAWTPRDVHIAPIDPGRPWEPSKVLIYPDRIGSNWQAARVRVRTGLVGRRWQSPSTRVGRMHPGRQVASLRKNDWPQAPKVQDLAVHLPRAVVAARAEDWDQLAAQMQPFGINPESVATAAGDKPKAQPSMDVSFGGELDPQWPADELDRKFKRMRHNGFTVPVVPVRRIRGDWRESYDEFFETIGESTTPVLGLCVGTMDVPDLLAVPEFLRRYEGKYHSVIVNYDLTNGHIDGTQGPPAFRAAVKRVSLALALTSRATPGVYTWLAVGYNRAPTWDAWVAAFDRQQFSGLMLSGHSAVSACTNPKVAAQIQKQMAKRVPDTRIGLVNFRLHRLDEMLYHRDDLAIERYTAIRDSLKQAGIAPLHISYTAGH
jgi:hypothetical protein